MPSSRRLSRFTICRRSSHQFLTLIPYFCLKAVSENMTFSSLAGVFLSTGHPIHGIRYAEGMIILKGQPRFYGATCFWSWWKDESKRTRKRQRGRKTGHRWTRPMCLPKMWYEGTSRKRCTMSSGQMSQLWI